MNEGATCSTSLSSDASATNWWACAEPPQDLQEVPEGRKSGCFHEVCMLPPVVFVQKYVDACWLLLSFFLSCAERRTAYISWIFIRSHSTVRWQFLLTLWGLLTATPWHDTYGRPEIREFAVQCLISTKCIERVKQQTWSRSNKMSYSKEPPTPTPN